MRRFFVVGPIGSRICAAFWALAFGLQASHAAAKRFNVNATNDAVDAAPGDGICETAPGNQKCTLRAAIQESNAFAGNDTVAIAAGTYLLTLTGAGENAAATGDLDVTDAVDIKGVSPAATIVDGNQADRVFDLLAGSSTVRIANLTIRHGAAQGGGGGIRFARPLRLYGSRVRNNSAPLGGGLFADVQVSGSHPALTMIHSELRSNTAGGGGGGYLLDATSVSFRDCEVVKNHADLIGGGIDASETAVTVIDSRFSENDANLWSALTTLDAVLSGSTFDANSAGASAGAAQINGVGEVRNCTFASNVAPLGGALTVGGDAVVDVIDSTFFDNTATYDEYQGGALVGTNGAILSVANSVFEDNYPGACSAYNAPTSAGYNMEDGDSCKLAGTGDSSVVSTSIVEPMLKKNGGPTPTFALFDGSPAIDSVYSMDPNESRDQRGADRPAYGSLSGEPEPWADRGAYEVCKSNLVTDLTDTDWDGIPDQCDGDDDGDGCPDALDAHPLRSAVQVGKYLNPCGEDDPYFVFEGNDSDGDGLLNCEDNDDDDDGVVDTKDSCPISASVAVCAPPGNRPCPTPWRVCIAGGCVELFLTFREVINPEHQVRFDRFEIINDTFYVAPQVGSTAPQAIRSISSGFAASAKQALLAVASAPSTRVAVEIWMKATRDTSERLVARVMEYDSGRVELGALDTGNVIVMAPPGREQGTLALRTTWAIGAEAADMPDLDGDRVPNSFDNCTYIANAGQRDLDRNGIGDACDANVAD